MAKVKAPTSAPRIRIKRRRKGRHAKKLGPKVR